MKQITIIYNGLLGNEQKYLATHLSSVLKKANYKTKIVPINSDTDTDNLIKSTNSDTCQLILSVNMAGYNLLSTDFSPSLNHLTINIVNYIDYPPEIFNLLFDMRINYTMSFLFSTKEAADYVMEHHPYVRNVFFTSSLVDYLPVYLDELDWRY